METLKLFEVPWLWPLGNGVNFGIIDFNPNRAYHKAQKQQLIDHENALLEVNIQCVLSQDFKDLS